MLKRMTLLSALFAAIFFISCAGKNEDGLNFYTTMSDVENLTTSSALVTISYSVENAKIEEYGCVYSTSLGNLTEVNIKNFRDSGEEPSASFGVLHSAPTAIGIFRCEMSGLNDTTTYYVKPYIKFDRTTSDFPLGYVAVPEYGVFTTYYLVPYPEVAVFYEGAEVIQNGVIDVGDVVVSYSKVITVVIGNTGREPLTIDIGNISITGSGAASFTMVTTPAGSVPPGGETSFVIECVPQSVVESNAFLNIPTNDETRGTAVANLKMRGYPANTEARLSDLTFSHGTLTPTFNSNVYEYEVRIQKGTTAFVRVNPIAIDADINTIMVNGIAQSSNTQSRDIMLSSTDSVTVVVTAQDGMTSVTYNVRVKVVGTWYKLYGEAGGRSGIFRAIGNGMGGIYASGYTSSNTAALFNIDENGNLRNTFQFASTNGTLGAWSIGYDYNDYFSVYEASNNQDYFLTKASTPNIMPTAVRMPNYNFNNEKVFFYPKGIVKRDGYYIVTGDSDYFPSGRRTGIAANSVIGAFVNRHNASSGYFEDSKLFSINFPEMAANSFRTFGTALLPNGDILFYGSVLTTTGVENAAAAAVNISGASPSVRWVNNYGEGSFQRCFFDGISIVLLGLDAIVMKFPASATTAVLAKPSGWPKKIPGIRASFNAGLSVSDGSGYIFVGQEAGSNSNGGIDVWVVKTNTNVEMIWDKHYGGFGDDYADAILETTDGFIIAGSTLSPEIDGQTRTGTEDIFIFKINKDGTMD